MTAMLETRALDKRFGGLHVTRGVSLQLHAGDRLALIGPNGAGKTTLVGMISGRTVPTRGVVRFGGRDITALKSWQRVGLGIVYTFQVTSIYRNLTVLENVALAAQRRGDVAGNEDDAAVVKFYAELAGLELPAKA